MYLFNYRGARAVVALAHAPRVLRLPAALTYEAMM